MVNEYEASTSDNSSGSFLLRWVIAGGILLTTSLISYALIEGDIQRMNADALVVNVSGRQRMLSQRIALLSRFLDAAETADGREVYRKQLLDRIVLMERSHIGLMYGDAEMGLPGGGSDQIRSLYFEEPDDVDKRVKRYLAEAKAFASAETEALRKQHLEYINQVVENEVLLQSLDKVVKAYEIDNEATLEHLKKNGFWLLIVDMSSLIFVALFVFRPLTRRITLQMENVKRVNAQYRQRTEELEEAQMATLNMIEDAQMARTEAERSRNESQLLASIVESSHDAIIGIDTSLRIQSWNTGAEDVLGVDSQKAIGRSITELLCVRETDRFSDALDQVIRGENVDNFEVEVSTDNMEWIQTSMTLSPIYRRSQGLSGASIILRDISDARKLAELKRYADDLKRSNRDLEQFAYVASHDLQEPIRRIVSFSQLLEKKTNSKLDEEEREYLQYIVTCVRRMNALIQDLLQYSRAGGVAIAFESVDIQAVVEEAKENLQDSIEECGVVVEAGKLPTISANYYFMVQLFQNLIGNAIKYRSDKAPRIEIRCVPKNDVYEFAVSDNGIGIDKAHLEKIFVIFERLHTDDRYSGTGIGLAVCHRIVERHGGNIWAESCMGEGTVMKFTLPRG